MELIVLNSPFKANSSSNSVEAIRPDVGFVSCLARNGRRPRIIIEIAHSQSYASVVAKAKQLLLEVEPRPAAFLLVNFKYQGPNTDIQNLNAFFEVWRRDETSTNSIRATQKVVEIGSNDTHQTILCLHLYNSSGPALKRRKFLIHNALLWLSRTSSAVLESLTGQSKLGTACVNICQASLRIFFTGGRPDFDPAY